MIVGRLADEVDAEGLVEAAERKRADAVELVVQLHEDGRARELGAAALGPARAGAAVGPVGRVAHRRRAQPVEQHGGRVGVGAARAERLREEPVLHVEEEQPAQRAQPAAERVHLDARRRGVHEAEPLGDERIEPLDQREAQRARRPVGGD